MDFAEQFAAGAVATNAVLVGIPPAYGAPDIPGRVGAHAVGNAGLGHLRKDLTVRQLSGPHIHVENADMRRIIGTVRETGIYHVQLLFVGRERDAVGFHEVVGHNFDVTGFRIDPVDVVLLLLLLGLHAFIVAADAVRRIGEPDRAVGGDDDVVRGVQLLAVVLVGDDRDRAVELGPGDPPAAVFASYQASFSINGIAVGIH